MVLNIYIAKAVEQIFVFVCYLFVYPSSAGLPVWLYILYIYVSTICKSAQGVVSIMYRMYIIHTL